ncbi:DALR anticodon-binding domain-containing protein [Coleofasciculus sp. E2-BRE-01]|uniref:DALR anticodon-binding domain-containing protein n=1 Tax=Coleofasciculus sp. E2-BRE-01 TaxID=3069524 RepID=UPI0032F99C5E
MEFKVAKNTSNYRVFTVKSFSKEVSIKSQFQRQLWQAIDRINTLPIAAQFTPNTVPLHRISISNSNSNSNSNYVCYRSAIALQLSSACQQTPLDIAHQLTEALLTLSQESADAIGINFTVEVLPPGWILLGLGDRALATYLQECFKIPYFPSVSQNDLNEKFHPKEGRGNRENSQHNQPDSDQLFPIQYVHARCCSLLHLADEQGLIEITDTGGGEDVGDGEDRGDGGDGGDGEAGGDGEDGEAGGDGEDGEDGGAGEDKEELFSVTTHQSPITIMSPNPIPWVEVAGESDSELVRLRLTHPAEWDLIVQLFDLLDVMSASDCQRWVKQGLAVSEAYEQFYKSCRIWGEVKIHDLPLAQARLGLIGVTQVVLRSLLEKLGVSAPRAL